MAKIKFGMMMTDARGKLGGQVFSKNRSGAYVRTKVTPVNPRTVSQQSNRALLGNLSSSWSALTDGERNSWNGAIEQWQKTNVFGDLQKPTGKNLFSSINKNLKANFPSASILRVPPTKSVLANYSIIAATYTVSTGALIIGLSGESVFGRYMSVKATPPVSNGTSYVKNLLRKIGVGMLVSGSGAVTAGPSYVAKFGALRVGDKVFVEVQEVTEKGELGLPSMVRVTIVA